MMTLYATSSSPSPSPSSPQQLGFSSTTPSPSRLCKNNLSMSSSLFNTPSRLRSSANSLVSPTSSQTLLSTPSRNSNVNTNNSNTNTPKTPTTNTPKRRKTEKSLSSHKKVNSNINIADDQTTPLTPEAPTTPGKKKTGTPMASGSPHSSPYGKMKRKRDINPSFDRLIPCRSMIDSEHANFLLMKESQSEEASTSLARENYKSSLTSAIFSTNSPSPSSPLTTSSGEKILSFSPKGMKSRRAKKQLFQVDDERTTVIRGSGDTQQERKISKTPERMLEAPDLVDDYYLNVLDWGKSNCIGVGLGRETYIWNSATAEASLLAELESDFDYVTSLKWNKDGSLLAIGTNNNCIEIWDVAAEKMIRKEEHHTARVAVMSWNGTTLSSGSRDSTVVNHDLRSHRATSVIRGHDQEVCGLRWSPDGKYLASGANDNNLMIWDASYTSTSTATPSSFPSFTSLSTPLYNLQLHTAAVKALAWCPWQRNLLASGGGTSDRCIRFWDITNGKCLNSIDTRSQVCALEWSKHSKELVSSHGFSQNQVSVWRYPTMNKIADLTGHTKRVLYLTQNPEGTTVVSGGGEMLRFWKIWERPRMSGLPLSQNDSSPVSPSARYRSFCVR